MSSRVVLRSRSCSHNQPAPPLPVIAPPPYWAPAGTGRGGCYCVQWAWRPGGGTCHARGASRAGSCAVLMDSGDVGELLMLSDTADVGPGVGPRVCPSFGQQPRDRSCSHHVTDHLLLLLRNVFFLRFQPEHVFFQIRLFY